MSSLTEVAQVSRAVIKWGIISIIVLMIGRSVFGSLIAWWKATHLPPPTMGFGTLPVIQFPQTDQPQVTYELQTITGQLPDLGSQADVMSMPIERPNLLAMERAVKEATSLGFDAQATKVNDLTYRWRSLTPIPNTLTMFIYDGRFTWDTDWAADPNFLAEKDLPTDDDAIKAAKDIVQKTGDIHDDLTSEMAQVSYLKGLGGTFQPAISLSDADFVQVDLFRAKYKDKYAFVTAKPTQGVVEVVISGNTRLASIVKVLYNYFPVDYTAVETYPLKPMSQAWQELNTGKGFVAQLDKGVTDVTVREIDLGYYDSFDPQHYMQPVYVFTGDNNFVAYVPAVGVLKK